MMNALNAAIKTPEWAGDDETAKTLMVPIIPDTLVEGFEYFEVIIYTNAGAYGQLGVVTNATITILDDERIQHRGMLAGIDAPEREQDFGERSKQSLSGLVYGQRFVVEHRKSDRYGGLVGKIKVAPMKLHKGAQA